MKKHRNLFGFTLVELIVVITIVGILSTVGFVSYSGYLTGARDSNRVSQLTKLSDSLQVYAASKTLPLPDDYIDITASGTVIAYQGYVGVDVLETIDYTNGGRDPKDDSYYTYYLTKDRKSLQLMAMMEEQQSIALKPIGEINANYEDRYPKVFGRKLGVLTYSDDIDPSLANTPVQEVPAISGVGELDIVLTDTVFTANITDAPFDKITGTGASLASVNQNASCKRIKQTGGAGNSGIYTISPIGEDLQVYCEMDIQGGGWTLVARLVTGSTGNFGWYTNRGNVNDNTDAYSMGETFEKLNFNEILLSGYNTGKKIDNFIFKYDVPQQTLLGLGSSTQNFSNCSTIKEFIKNSTDPSDTSSYNIATDCSQSSTFGNATVGNTVGYYTGGRTSGPSGFNVGTNFATNINAEQGMIFVK